MPAKPGNGKSRLRSAIILIASIIAAVTTYYSLPLAVNELARRTAAIFVVATIFWATEFLPLYATSLLLIAFEIFFLAHDGGIAGALPNYSDYRVDEAGNEIHLSYHVFLSSFSSHIIILFMGGFLLSAAVVKTGLDRVIAAKILRPFSRSPLTLLAGVIGIAAFFSMWMSNTATAAMMIAIVAPLIRSFPADDKFHRGLVLGVAFGANIGGIGTPIGTPPNAVGLAFLRQAGANIGFVDWMMIGVPLAVVLLIVCTAALYLFFPPEKGLALPTIERVSEKLDWRGRLTILILVVTILLWLTGKLHHINSAVVALTAAAALCALGVLQKRDVDTIDWNILLLMWGGLSLGEAMQQTGLVNYITTLPIKDLSPTLLVVVMGTLSLVVATFMSNTAAANLILPMAIALGASPMDKINLGILCALSCSFAMAMPVSTPPNAIAYGTGKVPAISMLRAGGIISLLSFVIMLVGYKFMLPYVVDASTMPVATP